MQEIYLPEKEIVKRISHHKGMTLEQEYGQEILKEEINLMKRFTGKKRQTNRGFINA